MEKHYLTATVLCLGTLTAFSSSVLHAAIPQAQQDALKAIFIEAGGPLWVERDRLGWEDAEITCDAAGLTCDANDNVTVLHPGASGTPTSDDTGLSERVADLPYLEILSLTSTGFSLPLPDAIRTLTRLKHLDLDLSWRAGTAAIPLPTWFGELGSLENLSILATPLAGNLPDYLGEHATLEVIIIVENPNIVGEIPPSIAYPHSLRRLALPSNNLSGKVPDEWAVPPADRVLDFVELRDNRLYSDNRIIVDKLAMQLADQRIATRIKATQYLGETEVALSWQAKNHRHQQILFSVYSRPLGGEFQLIDQDFSSDRHWRGTVPGLSPSTSREIQIREVLEDNSISSSEAVVIDTSVINHAPTFDHPAQDHVLRFPVDLNNALLPGWAYNMHDGDSGEDYLLFYRDIATPGYGLSVSIPSGTLRITSVTGLPPADGLAVLKLCDFADHRNPLGACTAEEVFILRHPDGTAGKDNMPSFYLPASIGAGTDYGFQQHEGFATNALPGNNATATSHLLYHNLWTTNSHLFEIDPWLSLPSGSLRFKFKQGVTGSSKVYFALTDHDPNSLENIGRFVEDVPYDRSAVHVLEISVGDASTDTTLADMQTVNIATQSDAAPAEQMSTSSISSDGGGGAGGLAFSGLGLFAAARRRR